MIFTLAFWKGAGERAVKTFVQTFIPALVVALGVTETGVLDVFAAPWLAALKGSLGISLGATFLSLATSLGNAKFVAGDSEDTSAQARHAADPDEPDEDDIDESDEDDIDDESDLDAVDSDEDEDDPDELAA